LPRWLRKQVPALEVLPVTGMRPAPCGCALYMSIMEFIQMPQRGLVIAARSGVASA
jgi:hypothetical protein